MIDSIWLSCLHTWCWSCLAWHQREAALAGILIRGSCSPCLAGPGELHLLSLFPVTVYVPSHLGHWHPPTQGRLPGVRAVPLLSSSDVHEIRLGTWESFIFTKPLMMCNTFLGSGLVWGWRPQVGSKIRVTQQWLGLSRLVQIRLCCDIKWIECYLLGRDFQEISGSSFYLHFGNAPGTSNDLSFFSEMMQRWWKILENHKKSYVRKGILFLCWQAILGT